MGHGLLVYVFSNKIANEQKLGLRVVDDVMNLFCIELMQYGHGNGAIGQRGHEGYGPVGRVASADGYLVALLHVAVLHQNVQLLYFSGNVVKLERGALIVCQGVAVPVFSDYFFYILVET